MTDFGKKLYHSIDSLIRLCDNYGMMSEILLAEHDLIEVINKYNEIELKLREWQKTKSLELASEICKELSHDK